MNNNEMNFETVNCVEEIVENCEVPATAGSKGGFGKKFLLTATAISSIGLAAFMIKKMREGKGKREEKKAKKYSKWLTDRGHTVMEPITETEDFTENENE